MLLVNQILHNRYRILRQLGHGGMGAVYEAHDSVFDTTCAVKEIIIDLSKSSNPKQHEMVMLAFEREAKLLARIKHDAVPHVRDYFTEDAKQYLIMELVEGKDIGEIMEERKSPFPLDDVLRWTDQLLDGLDYLHTQNPPIFHRDLKPQNLKITPRGKIKLLDFGIAKGGQEVPNQQTINNQTFVAATLNYSPVEQIFRVLDPVFREVLTQRYEARVNAVMAQNADARSDLYALGATVYHMLTDVLPIDSLKRTVEVWAGKPDPLAHPTSLNNRIPPEVAAVLLKSMELDQARRYASALEMQQALQHALTAIKSRESAQGQQTLQMDQKTAELQATQLGGITGDTNAATQVIPQELLPPAYRPNTSEQTIQAGAMPPGFGSTTGDSAPPPTPFSTGGQPTEMVAFGAGAATGGTPPPPPQNFQPQFEQQGNISSGAPVAPNYLAQQPEKKSSKIWWILPILFILFLVVAAAAGGIFVLYQSNFGGGGVSNTTPTPTASPAKSPSASPATSPSSSPSASPSVSPSATPSATPEKTETPKPTAEPTRQAVPPPVKTPVKTTPKPTPKKGSDCIFSGDC